MSVLNENQLLGAPASTSQYQIQRSIRLNAPDSAYLSRNFGTPTTQGTFTFSAWVKRANLGSVQQLFGVSTNHSFGFTAGDALNLTFGGVSALTTTAVFRDPSAWYHIVWTQSGTAHTIYVNNVSVGTATATSSVFNTAVAHQIGAANTTNYLSTLLADVILVDGQALTPSTFGETDATTGEWIPKAYTGTYGTNGFKLNFSNNSAATATTLGADSSGNGNNWTPNNLSVTAGAGNDSLVDTPTSYGTDTGVGGEVRGNYATWNPLAIWVSTAPPITNGNLTYGNAVNTSASSTIGMSSGKWYWELTCSGLTANQVYFGITNVASASSRITGLCGIRDTGALTNSNGATENGTGTTTFVGGDVVRFAYDADNKRLFIGKNGTWLNSSDPAAGTNASYTNVQGSTVYAIISDNGSSPTIDTNFGQRVWTYTAPSGFKALCDTNLPAPTIVKPSTVMDTVLYTGNGGNLTPTSSLGFSPDLVWIKSRSNAYNHALYDTVRGPTLELSSNQTIAEAMKPQGLTAFNSNGFSLGNWTSVNFDASTTYAAWCWDAGSSTVTNTAGTIQSSVRANASAGFSIVTYTGNGTAGATVGHGLGVAPSLLIVKHRGSSTDWATYHSELGGTKYVYLNTTSEALSGVLLWNNTAPSASTFSLGGFSGVNANGGGYLAYCFAPVAGYSAFGSYTGNGSADGPFVYTGFRPRWVMVKQTTTASATNWRIFDASRSGYNVTDLSLAPNSSISEGTTVTIDFCSNGFKLRNTSSDSNVSAGTYIYAAFAEFPFQYARAR